MPIGRPKAELVLQAAEQEQLQSMVRSRSIPAALRVRAQIVLASRFKHCRCATPGWDNSPRRRQDAIIFHNGTPEHYEAWLRTLAQDTLSRFQGEE